MVDAQHSEVISEWVFAESRVSGGAFPLSSFYLAATRDVLWKIRSRNARNHG